jgi:hypothetical protein
MPDAEEESEQSEVEAPDVETDESESYYSTSESEDSGIEY